MLKNVNLHNFRNYREMQIFPGEDINILRGENGQGKTNVLEAIYFIAMLRSFRTAQLKELKTIGSGGFCIEAGILKKAGWVENLAIEYGENNRKLKIDGQIVNKASEFIRRIKTVVFTPGDINIIMEGSRLRRRFFDMFISELEPSYFNSLRDYGLALGSRNVLLRRPRTDIAALRAYETVIAAEACKIIGQRKAFIKKISDEVGVLLKNFYPQQKFLLRYRTDCGAATAETYLERFDAERKKDLEKGFTGFGPQLDDFEFILENRNLRSFGSTGQCRTAALCLKMAEVNLLCRDGNSDNLTVLADDVTGELDEPSKALFFRVIGQAGQKFFTFTIVPKDEFFADARLFEVDNGKITEK